MVAAQSHKHSRNYHSVPVQRATHVSGMPAGRSTTAGPQGFQGRSFAMLWRWTVPWQSDIGNPGARGSRGLWGCCLSRRRAIFRTNELQPNSPGLRRRC